MSFIYTALAFPFKVSKYNSGKKIGKMVLLTKKSNVLSMCGIKRSKEKGAIVFATGETHCWGKRVG